MRISCKKVLKVRHGSLWAPWLRVQDTAPVHISDSLEDQTQEREGIETKSGCGLRQSEV